MSKAITLVESQNKKHEPLAEKLIESCLTNEEKTIRIGITGTPGVGKSTFVEALGMLYIEQGKKVAVLTIDPSSPENQGSILGDKSRMDRLSNHSQAYVRSSPSRTNLGGATDRTRETIVLCESAGYDVIIIETVGVGQSETEVNGLVDLVTLLVLPGSGDEIQGIKRGIMEIADMIVINKSDKFSEVVVKESINAHKFATHLRPHKNNKPPASIIATSAITGDHMEAVVTLIDQYLTTTKANKYFYENRAQQMLKWLDQKIETKALSKIRQRIKEQNLSDIHSKILSGEMTVHQASELIVKNIIDR